MHHKKYSGVCGDNRQRYVAASHKARIHLYLPTLLRCSLLLRSIPLVFRRRIEYIEVLSCTWSNFEDACHVAASVAVVRRRPYRRQSIVVHDAEPLHAQLMRSEDMYHVVDFEELLHDLRSECIPCSSW